MTLTLAVDPQGDYMLASTEMGEVIPDGMKGSCCCLAGFFPEALVFESTLSVEVCIFVI